MIFKTGLEDDGKLSAKVNGRIVQLSGNRNYLPLSPYNRYEVELQNSKNSLDSYDIVTGRKSQLTLYPGNVAVIEPEVKQMVTVSGRIRAEDGTLLANARINNHIGRTRTDENGEFVMDVDKSIPPSISVTVKPELRSGAGVEPRAARCGWAMWSAAASPLMPACSRQEKVMKAKWLACLIMLTAALCVTRVNAAVNKTTARCGGHAVCFVENNSDDNFFVTRAARWTRG